MNNKIMSSTINSEINKMKLITTEIFNTVSCDFYLSESDQKSEIMLTREQIGSALGYKDPKVAIAKIHLKHKDRLDKFSGITKLVTPSGTQDTYLYTERGVMEICRWSRQPKANEFMDWCWDIIAGYRNNTLNSNNHSNFNINAANTEMLESLSDRLSDIETTLSKLTSQLNQQKSKPQNSWSLRMLSKYKALANHFNITLRKLYSELFTCFQETYGIDLNNVVDDYCISSNIDSCYTMDAIENTPEVRELFEDMVNQLIVKYGIFSQNRVGSLFSL